MDTSPSSISPRGRRALPWVLLVSAVLPTFATWLYFVVLADSPVVLLIYGATKVIQFGLPLAWLAVERRWPEWRRPQWEDLGWGVGVGAAIVALGLAAYYGYFQNAPGLASMPPLVQQKLQQMHIDRLGAFVAFASFLSLLHSGMEEYYWRWFVFGRARQILPLGLATGLAAAAFAAHHALVLRAYLPQSWGLVALFTGCVAVGGAIWSLVYQRRGTLWASWLAHALVDVGIMWIGYDMAWGK